MSFSARSFQPAAPKAWQRHHLDYRLATDTQPTDHLLPCHHLALDQGKKEYPIVGDLETH